MNTAVKTRAHARLLRELPAGAAVDARAVCAVVAEEAPLLSDAERGHLVDELLADLVGLGPLEPLLADPAITDVMVNGDGAVWIERRGRLERTAIAIDAATVLHLVGEGGRARSGCAPIASSPVVDARLPRISARERPGGRRWP